MRVSGSPLHPTPGIPAKPCSIDLHSILQEEAGSVSSVPLCRAPNRSAGPPSRNQTKPPATAGFPPSHLTAPPDPFSTGDPLPTPRGSRGGPRAYGTALADSWWGTRRAQRLGAPTQMQSRKQTGNRPLGRRKGNASLSSPSDPPSTSWPPPFKACPSCPAGNSRPPSPSPRFRASWPNRPSTTSPKPRAGPAAMGRSGK